MTVLHRFQNRPARRPTRGLAGVTLVALAAAGLASGCSDDVGPDPMIGMGDEEQLGELPEVARMGEVHITVQPEPDAVFSSPQVELDARFVEYRDIGSQDAASRAGLTPVPSEILRPGQCMPTQELARLEATRLDSGDGFDTYTGYGVGEDPEVILLDVGDVRVGLGDRDYVVPISLVPDLVPWVSGVEYAAVDQELPNAVSAPDGSTPIHLEVDGAPEAGLPALSLDIDLPRSFSLLPTYDTEPDGALTLAWEPSETGERRMVLELLAYADGDPAGEHVTCVVPDTGAAALDLGQLELAGLGEGETISVTARRLVTLQVDAGDFRGIRVVGETRDRQLVAMPE